MTERAAPGVSVVIPTLNPGAEFAEILALIRAQRLEGDSEIIVIDSGSTDGTLDRLRGGTEAVRLLEIAPSAYDHGLTRNLGLNEARGSVVVFTSQDARPADDEWLQRLVDCFREPRVAGAYSRQLPRADANPFALDRLSRYHAATDVERRFQFVRDQSEYDTLPPQERRRRAAFDNVSSAVRRAVALEIPFRSCSFGEDLDWGLRALLAGHWIAYEPRSRVVHSHNRSIWYEFRRSYLHHQHLQRLFGMYLAPGFGRLVWRAAGGGVHYLRVVARHPGLGFAGRVKWWARVPAYAATQSLAQFLGIRSVASLERGSRFYRFCDRLLGRGV